jgi:cation diffusion facilitator CzcD-associated flavoprotein CzcO
VDVSVREGSAGERSSEKDYDAIIVGAGFGGLYAAYRLRRDGLSLLGIEGAGGVGGVWYHNRYPGARVDVESIDYCYYFSPELYREWQWSERYAAQPELLEYLNHVADRFDLRRSFLFGHWVVGAQWHPELARYRVTTSAGLTATCRFLVMTTGQLSADRRPEFPGLEAFQGEWVQTSHWPERDVALEGRRIGVIGTGSSGVQTITAIAPLARQLTVFQRSPNYSVPAWNGPFDAAKWGQLCADVAGERAGLLATGGGQHRKLGSQPAGAFSPAEQLAMMESAWAHGGHGMSSVFSDQRVNKESNDIVADFVRSKVRAIVKDPVVADILCSHDHPIGTRRLIIDTGYYEVYNRDNVTLVDIRAHPIERITPTGIQTSGGHYELDLIIFALGFHAFSGALDRANIRNEHGEQPSDRWKRGPRTLLGLMTPGFPNLFTVTGPGSPSVLANMALHNEYHADWIADCIGYMMQRGFDTIEATDGAVDAWWAHCAEFADKLLRRQVKNYMVHVNADGSRVFMPYVGGLDRYVREADSVAAEGYRGFRFGQASGADATVTG